MREAKVTDALHGLFSLPCSARTCTAYSTNFGKSVSTKSMLLTADSSVTHTLVAVAGEAVICALYFSPCTFLALAVPAAAFFFFTKLIFAAPAACFLSLMLDITGVAGMPCLVAHYYQNHSN